MSRTRIKVKRPKQYVQVEIIHKGTKDTLKDLDTDKNAIPGANKE